MQEHTSRPSGSREESSCLLLKAADCPSWAKALRKAVRPLGRSLIGKQQRFVSTAIYVSSAGQVVSASEGR